MENALIRSKTSFYICHRADMSEEEKEHMLQIEREEFKKSNCRIVSYIAFPGDLLKLYEAERQRLATSLVHLNKYEYLLSQLQLY